MRGITSNSENRDRTSLPSSSLRLPSLPSGYPTPPCAARRALPLSATPMELNVLPDSDYDKKRELDDGETLSLTSRSAWHMILINQIRGLACAEPP